MFVERHDPFDGILILFLLLGSDASVLKHPLPFFWQALFKHHESINLRLSRNFVFNRRKSYRELTSIIIKAYVSDMDGVFGGGDLRTAGTRGAQHAADEGGDAALLLPGR